MRPNHPTAGARRGSVRLYPEKRDCVIANTRVERKPNEYKHWVGIIIGLGDLFK